MHNEDRLEIKTHVQNIYTKTHIYVLLFELPGENVSGESGGIKNSWCSSVSTAMYSMALMSDGIRFLHCSLRWCMFK